MTEHPLVSIVIPTYTKEGDDESAGKKLTRCIGGFLGQPYVPIEIIVVDDGTIGPDFAGIHQTISAFNRLLRDGQRILPIRLMKNSGQAAAFNRGIAAAAGKYILPFNDDDYICASFIQKAVGIMEYLPEKVGFVYSDYMTTDNWNDMHSFKKALPPPQPWNREMMKEMQLAPVIALYRADKMKKVLWDETLDHNEDWDYILRFTKGGTDGFYIPGQFSFIIYNHPGSKSRADQSGVERSLEVIKKRIAEGYYD